MEDEEAPWSNQVPEALKAMLVMLKAEVLQESDWNSFLVQLSKKFPHSTDPWWLKVLHEVGEIPFPPDACKAGDTRNRPLALVNAPSPALKNMDEEDAVMLER